MGDTDYTRPSIQKPADRMSELIDAVYTLRIDLVDALNGVHRELECQRDILQQIVGLLEAIEAAG